MARGRKKKSDDEDKPQWEKSRAKAYLQKLLVDGDIPLYCDGRQPRQIFNEFCKDTEAFADFNEYDYLFPGRLSRLRELIAIKYDIARADEEALENDRKIYPLKTITVRGYPRWGGSRAKKLLKRDIDKGHYPRLKPSELHKRRPEYLEFPLDVFRKHIHQELKTRKFVEQYCKKDYYPPEKDHVNELILTMEMINLEDSSL